MCPKQCHKKCPKKDPKKCPQKVTENLSQKNVNKVFQKMSLPARYSQDRLFNEKQFIYSNFIGEKRQMDTAIYIDILFYRQGLNCHYPTKSMTVHPF